MPITNLNLFDSSSSSSEEEDVTVQVQRRQQQRQRRRKIYRDRINFEFFLESSFIERFRISRSTAQRVLNSIGASIEHKTNMNHALSSKQQLLVALHFLGTGCQFHAVSDMHGVHKSTVSRVVQRVSSAILRRLFPLYVRWPNDCAYIPIGFSQVADFPRVAGIVDGTLINILAPRINESDYVDRYGDHSINAMVVCGPKHEFFYASARWPGSVHDNRILRNSTLYEKWEINGKKHI